MFDTFVSRARSLLVLLFMLFALMAGFAFGARQSYAEPIAHPYAQSQSAGPALAYNVGAQFVGSYKDIHASNLKLAPIGTADDIQDTEPDSAASAREVTAPLVWFAGLFYGGVVFVVLAVFLRRKPSSGIGTSPSFPEAVPLFVEREVTEPIAHPYALTPEELTKVRGNGIGTSPSDPNPLYPPAGL